MRGGHEAIAALAVQALGLALVAIDGRRRILLTNSACAEILRANGSLVERDGRLLGRGAEQEQAFERILRRVGAGQGAVGRVGRLFTIGIALEHGKGLVLLFLVDTERPLACPVEHIAHLFGLSPAEARLAYALASGRTLMQHAAASNVALSTVRTQLRYVLKKSSLHRQSDLIRVIAGLPALRSP
jgi:DNA-binding CsgD family transcriptional regulator